MSEHLTDAMVEEAAKARWDYDCAESGDTTEWDMRYPSFREFDIDAMRAALEAVVPDIIQRAQVEVLEEGDGYHTHEELYEYRMLYNALAANAMPDRAVKSWRHSDGEMCFGGGWFVVYLDLPTGQVSNHYKAEHWSLFDVPEVDLAPEYDGHTPAEAAARLSAHRIEQGGQP